VGYERSEVAIDGGAKRPMTIRVTHIYRREDGEWELLHRHADFAPVDESPR
jgi:ketosteroid isomerase-like protein